MSRAKKFLIALLVSPLVLIALFLVVIGPWPTYRDSHYRDRDYYRQAMEDIATQAAANELTATPGRLMAGWAERKITPAVGVPLGGYSGRKGGKNSTGVRDDLYVRALAFSDGRDTAVLVGSDMLIIPPNLSAAVRERVRSAADLAPAQVLFNASHTHCGPGGFMPGLISEISGGEYDPKLIEDLTNGFTDAIVEAKGKLAPAALASGGVDAAGFIRNRARSSGGVDPELSFLVVRRDDGATCYLASFSAHPTIFGGDMMEFSAEYPGELVRHIQGKTRHDAHYLGGAVGSMSPQAPEAPTPSERVTAMGQALAELILANDDDLVFSDAMDVAAVGVPVGMPPYQIRVFENNTGWRLSPLAAGLAGLDRQGWIHGVRLGQLFFVGLPCDFSGEISVEWKEWARGTGLDLWTLSFSSTYCGYFSPDRHYLDTPLGYETGIMSWYGPNIEAYFTDLFHELVQRTTPGAGGTPGE